MSTVTCPACGTAIPREEIARALGAAGASAGGRARADAMPAEERQRAAFKAAQARWKRKRMAAHTP